MFLSILADCANAFAAEEPLAVDFEKDVAPILLRSCVGCHNTSGPKAELDLTRRETPCAVVKAAIRLSLAGRVKAIFSTG